MLDNNKKLISLDELSVNNQEMKKYIQNQGLGLTEEQVRALIKVQISEDNTYEPLDSEV